MHKCLFLDCAKVAIKFKNLPFEQARVALFAPFSQAKKMTTPEEPHSIYVLPKKNTAQSIDAAAREILTHHHTAYLAIISPRPKWRAVAEQLQKDFPQAHIISKKRYGKKAKQFLFESNLTSTILSTLSGDDANISAVIDQKEIVKTEALSQPEVFTLLATHENAPTNISAIVAWLRKNQPKKKVALINALSSSFKQYDPQEVIAQLQQSGCIKIDHAENIRYQIK